MSNIIKAGDSVIFLWSGSTPPTELEKIVSTLKEDVGSNGKVQVEHEAMLLKCRLKLLY